jgi:phenylacetate-CoA ligase
MHLWQDSVFSELVHPRTKRRVPYGEEGVTVYTHLERNSQPMIRYWAGDIARWSDEPCACGRTYPRLPNGIYGRADDMFVVRGENVYPSAIENVLRSIEGFGDEFRIVITREKIMDEMILQVEALPEVPKENHRGLKRELEMRMKAAGLRSKVQMMASGSLERTEFKARRVIDQRDLYDELSDK